MKTLALSDQISFLSPASAVEGGGADGAADNLAATGRHDAFATILAESPASAGKQAGPAPDKTAAALTVPGVADTVAAVLEIGRPGLSGTMAAAMQSTLQDAAIAKTQTPDVAVGDLRPALPAAIHPSRGDAAALSGLQIGTANSASIETAATSAETLTETTESPKAAAPEAKEQSLPGMESAEAAVLMAAAFPASAAPVSAGGTAAPAAETAAAKPLSTQADQAAQVEGTTNAAAEATPKLRPTQPAASAYASIPTVLHRQEGMPASRDETRLDPADSAAKPKARAALTAGTDASAPEKLAAIVAKAAPESPAVDSAFPIAPQMAAASSATQAQPGTSQGRSIAEITTAPAARQVNTEAEAPRQAIPAFSGQGQLATPSAQPPVAARVTSKPPAAEDRQAVAEAAKAEPEHQPATPATGQAAPFAAASAAEPTQMSAANAVAGPNKTAAPRDSAGPRAAEPVGTAQTAAAGTTRAPKQAPVSQDVSVRVSQPADAVASSVPRESLAESRVMAALASRPSSVEAENTAPSASQAINAAGTELTQGRTSTAKATRGQDPAATTAAPAEPKTEKAAASDTTTPSAAQPKSVSGTDAFADKGTTTPVTASQPAPIASPAPEPQPRTARLRETKDVASVKDRAEPASQVSGAAADAAVKTADATAAPAADTVDSLSAAPSTGTMSFGTTGTTATLERGAQIPGGDPGAATGAHRAASPHAIAHQMSLALADAGNRTVELTLSPEELGKVRMTLHSSDGAITVTVQAERPETLDLMRRNIESLARDFRDMGYSNVGFDFGQQTDQRSSAQQQAATETTLKQATPDRDAVARFDTTSIALQSSPRTASGGLDLRI